MKKPLPYSLLFLDARWLIDMVEGKSWEEFRDSGMLWFINMILHTFGWAICVDVVEGEFVGAYPARVKFRGFTEEINTTGYQRISKFMKENSEDLYNESLD